MTRIIRIAPQDGLPVHEFTRNGAIIKQGTIPFGMQINLIGLSTTKEQLDSGEADPVDELREVAIDAVFYRLGDETEIRKAEIHPNIAAVGPAGSAGMRQIGITLQLSDVGRSAAFRGTLNNETGTIELHGATSEGDIRFVSFSVFGVYENRNHRPVQG